MRINRFKAKPLSRTILIASIGVILVLCLGIVAHANSLDTSTSLHPFTLTSPDFHDGGPLPQSSEFGVGFGCNGANKAPELNWTGVPAGTKGFALSMTDYDAPVLRGFHHWIVYNIPAGVRELEGNHPYSEGTNDFGLTGYDGPCPPPDGQLHHYVFRLYALTVSHISGTALTFDQLLTAIDSHFLGMTVIIGTFKRP